MELREHLRRLTLHELSVLCRSLSAELFHRNIYRWRAPLHAADDLDSEATETGCTRITRRLDASASRAS